MTLNIAICDDEKKDIELLEKNILQYNIETDNNIIVSSFLSANELLSDYDNHPYNVVLLDIEMPCINGMELGKRLREMDDNLFIVFTTSYPEYMQDSFEVQPFQFLTKPIDHNDVCKLFNNIINKINRSSKSIVIIDSENEKQFVALNDILFISSMKEKKSYIRYQLFDKEFVSRGTLSEIEHQLATRGFVSPSRGFLVNVKQIQAMKSTSIILKNGFEIPISRRRAKELQQIYTQYIIDIL